MARRVTAGHESLRASEHPSGEPTTPPWELAAVDADGDELYRTEYQDSREEAEQAAQEATESLPNDRIDDEVDRFEPRRTE